jgi:hypothetical protein
MDLTEKAGYLTENLMLFLKLFTTHFSNNSKNISFIFFVKEIYFEEPASGVYTLLYTRRCKH